MVLLHSFDELYLTSTFDTSVFDAVICELHDKVKHKCENPIFRTDVPFIWLYLQRQFYCISNIYTHHFSSVFVAAVHVSAN